MRQKADEEVRQEILYLHKVVKLSFRQIAQRCSVSRRYVSKICHGYNKKERQRRIPTLEAYHSLIANWYNEYPNLKAEQVYLWLKETGVNISYPSVVLYTKSFRKKKEKLYHHLNFLPAEEGQVDWFFITHPVLGKLCCFVLILSYSRYLFAHIFMKSSFEFFIEGHLMAFSVMGGVPYNLRYDNLKSVVLKLKPHVQYNGRFLEFCSHYGIKIRLCNVASANEKGRVERAIRSIKESFFSISNYSSLKIMNQALHEWIEKKNSSIHRATGYTPLELFLKKEKERLNPLPALSWQNINIHPPVKTTKTGMIIFDTNAYSVPEYLVGKPLSIHSTPTEVMIYDGDKRVASHPRSYQRHKQIINPIHRSYTSISHKAKMQRIYDVITNLDPVMDNFITQNQTCGENPYHTAYQVFKLLKKETRTIIIGVAKECIQRKSPRLRTFLSYLDIQPQENKESVHPNKKELLDISYKPRSLEVYNNE